MNDFSSELKESSFDVGKPCSSCVQNEMAPNLYLGPGEYWDSDLAELQDYPYEGIPICTFCCGLGIEYSDNSQFQDHAKRIRNLRFLYRPVDGFPPPYEVARYLHLKLLIKEVQKVTEEFGTGTDGSLAQRIQRGSLDNTLHKQEESARNELKSLAFSLETSNPSVESLRLALLSIYQGKSLEEAESLFKQAENKYPDLANIPFEHAMFLLRVKRDSQISLDLFIKATNLDSQQPEYFYRTGEMFYHLNDFHESSKWLSKTRRKLADNPEDTIETKTRDLEKRLQYRLNEAKQQVTLRLEDAQKWAHSLYQLIAGRALFSDGRYVEALDYLGKAEKAEGAQRYQEKISELRLFIQKYHHTQSTEIETSM